MGIEFGGLLGLIILILDVWAILKIVQSSRDDTNKIVWIVVIIVLPVIGLLLWLLLGNRKF